MALDRKPAPNDLSAFWMPFTANRQFKKNPRMFVAAKDMHYTTAEGRQVLDGTAGLWCCNAGHCRPKITEAIQKQAAELDYAPAFQMGHPIAFELANRIIDIAPKGIEHVFYTNSGSESVETALKMAIGYHRARGEGARTRLRIMSASPPAETERKGQRSSSASEAKNYCPACAQSGPSARRDSTSTLIVTSPAFWNVSVAGKLSPSFSATVRPISMP